MQFYYNFNVLSKATRAKGDIMIVLKKKCTFLLKEHHDSSIKVNHDHHIRCHGKIIF